MCKKEGIWVATTNMGKDAPRTARQLAPVSFGRHELQLSGASRNLEAEVLDMGLSINGGTLKWMIYKGKSHENG